MTWHFRSRTIFIGVAIVAVLVAFIALIFCQRIWAERSAEETYRRRYAEWEAELLADPLEICEAAKNSMIAQQRLPWRNHDADYESYLERLRKLETLVHWHADMGLFGSWDGRLNAKKKAEQITQWRHEAESSSK